MATAYNLRSRDEPDDFDEFDSTPYGGGYDLFATFGRPLPPSDETCYPCSAPSTSYDAPHYAAEEPSPYAHHGGRKTEEEGYGGSGYGSGRKVQGEDEGAYGSGGYQKPKPYGEETQGSYGGGYGGGNYGRKKQDDDSDDEKKNRYAKRDDSDDEKKERYEKHHHHRRHNYDD
ncbi:unnamed protein product [Triticum turgidum subsp. durum]|uniref:Glycine-rich protein n=1 Tax=Triticum turgidum subsp. durum TaxID=4567 RepID=A0A9R1BXA1_TRITD|nr:unnamed protein product [Triticum turgidum subsp. durum]